MKVRVTWYLREVLIRQKKVFVSELKDCNWFNEEGFSCTMVNDFGEGLSSRTIRSIVMDQLQSAKKESEIKELKYCMSFNDDDILVGSI